MSDTPCIQLQLGRRPRGARPPAKPSLRPPRPEILAIGLALARMMALEDHEAELARENESADAS